MPAAYRDWDRKLAFFQLPLPRWSGLYCLAMNRVIKARLIALGLCVALMGALIVLVTMYSEEQAGETSARLGDVDTESFRIADRFKDKLRYANDKMRRYATAREPAVWEEFLTATGELEQWIAGERLQLSTERERAMLRQMDTACATYLANARSLHARMETSGESGASLAEYNTFSLSARHLADLGQELARIHYDTRNLFLAEVTQTLTRLRLSVLGLVGLLFVFGVALAAGIYRDLIAPLQVKLVESQALAERREKLASLGLLAAGVAHEIRNPLTAIRAAVFLQQKKLQPGSPQSADLEIVEREIVRLERIVNAFLQFARPAPPELATIPADRPLQEVQALFAEQLLAGRHSAPARRVARRCASMWTRRKSNRC